MDAGSIVASIRVPGRSRARQGCRRGEMPQDPPPVPGRGSLQPAACAGSSGHSPEPCTGTGAFPDLTLPPPGCDKAAPSPAF